MRSSRQTNMGTVAGLIAAIVVLNVAIFFVLMREDKDQEAVATAATRTNIAPRPAAGALLVPPTTNPGPAETTPQKAVPPVPPIQDTDTAPPAHATPTPVVPRETAPASRSHSRRQQRTTPPRKTEPEPTPIPTPVPTPTKTQASVDILSVPSGATVSLDGVFIGKTPIRGIKIASGGHSVAVSHAGFEPQVVRLKSSLGKHEKVSVKMREVAHAQPESPVAQVTQTVRRPARTPRVSTATEGNVSRGKSLVRSSCNACHSKRGESGVRSKRYTRSQWDRFFASGSHDRYERLGGAMNMQQLADVKAYVKTKSADAARNQGAGIR